MSNENFDIMHYNFTDTQLKLLNNKISIIRHQKTLNPIFNNQNLIIYFAKIDKNLDLKLSFVSENAEKILGYTKTEIMAQGWKAFSTHPDDLEIFNNAIRTYPINTAFTISYRMMHKGGDYSSVCDTMTISKNIFDGADEIIGCIMDIGENDAIEKRLLQNDKMATLGRIAASILHDLKQPISNISLSADNLRQRSARGALSQQILSKQLERISEQVARASGMMQEMEAYGRVPEGTPAAISLAPLLKSVKSIVAPQMTIDNIILELDGINQDFCVNGKSILLEQALVNLVLNARDSIKERRSRGDMSPGKINIINERLKSHILLHIEDNGSGISEEALGHLFEPFFTTKPPGHGSGLGLSIAHGVIKNLGGRLEAENILNGARFTIELPLAEPNAP